MKPHHILLLSLCLASCTTTKYYVSGNYRLNTVEINNSVSSVQTASYTDDIIDATVQVSDSSIKLKLANKTDSSMKILWDAASYVDPLGNSHRIVHTGILYIDKTRAQVPSVVPKGAHYTDELLPEDCFEWVNTSGDYSHQYNRSGYWKRTPLMQMASYDTKWEAENASVTFAPVQLLLPIEVNGLTHEYTFTFTSKTKKVSTAKELDIKKTAWTTLGATFAASLMIVFTILSMQ